MGQEPAFHMIYDNVIYTCQRTRKITHGLLPSLLVGLDDAHLLSRLLTLIRLMYVILYDIIVIHYMYIMLYHNILYYINVVTYCLFLGGTLRSPVPRASRRRIEREGRDRENGNTRRVEETGEHPRAAPEHGMWPRRREQHRASAMAQGPLSALPSPHTAHRDGFWACGHQRACRRGSLRHGPGASSRAAARGQIE